MSVLGLPRGAACPNGSEDPPRLRGIITASRFRSKTSITTLLYICVVKYLVFSLRAFRGIPCLVMEHFKLTGVSTEQADISVVSSIPRGIWKRGRYNDPILVQTLTRAISVLVVVFIILACAKALRHTRNVGTNRYLAASGADSGGGTNSPCGVEAGGYAFPGGSNISLQTVPGTKGGRGGRHGRGGGPREGAPQQGRGAFPASMPAGSKRHAEGHYMVPRSPTDGVYQVPPRPVPLGAQGRSTMVTEMNKVFLWENIDETFQWKDGDDAEASGDQDAEETDRDPIYDQIQEQDTCIQDLDDNSPLDEQIISYTASASSPQRQLRSRLTCVGCKVGSFLLGVVFGYFLSSILPNFGSIVNSMMSTPGDSGNANNASLSLNSTK